MNQTYEWVYNHHKDKVETNWNGQPTDYFLKKGFLRKKVWQCRLGRLDYLTIPLPYGVVLRINELKERKFFNAFNVLAPIDAWMEEPKAQIDPIVVGTIWEMPIDYEGWCGTAGETNHFFIAQW